MGAYSMVFLSTVFSLMTKVYVLYSSDLPFVATLGWIFLVLSVLLDFGVAGQALMNIYESSAQEEPEADRDLVSWMLRFSLLLLLDVIFFLVAIWCASSLYLAPWVGLVWN